MSNEQMPKEEGLDHSVSVAREGYLYILNRRKSFQEDVFETRVLGQKAVCMGGEEAARLFYDEEKFLRHGAAPKRVIETLFGKGGVQTLDDVPRRHRKEAFMSLMTRENIAHLSELFAKEWDETVDRWVKEDEIVFYEEAKKMLARTACQWAGVPLEEKDGEERIDDIASMFESPAKLGPSHWKGRRGRNQIEKWVEGLVEQVRDRKLAVPETSALHVFSWHQDLEENLLDPQTAAVEVINIIRPITAVAIYLNFTVLALHQFPKKAEKVKGDEKYKEMFVQEVRRFYPFFPFAGAKVRKDFTWNGYEFKEGMLALLDLYGTNHDPEIWENPDRFEPERFTDWKESPFSFIPQGGGEFLDGHRCAGEWATIALMKESLGYLTEKITYDFPEQDASYSLVSMPSIPQSEINLKNIHWAEK